MSIPIKRTSPIKKRLRPQDRVALAVRDIPANCVGCDYRLRQNPLRYERVHTAPGCPWHRRKA